MKSLHLGDFHGAATESVEAWLATIPQEVERQAGPGGDTWTAEELYYGVTAHLKDAASKWLITLSETMRDEDKTLSYLLRKLKKKYGRIDNMFKVQQKLASRKQQPGERLSDYAAILMDIGFGKRVPAETYVEAFISGINNPTTAIQIRAYELQTLEDAVQFAEAKCGEYGEGYRVTEWRQAKRRHRENRMLGEEAEQPPRTKQKTSTSCAQEQLDWKQLGLDIGRDSPPRYDNAENTINQLEATAKRDPLSVAALQALILSAGARKEEHGTRKSTKPKAQVLEVKAETQNNYQQSAATNSDPQWQHHGRGGRFSRGRFGSGRGYGYGGRGSGRGGALARYGPGDNRPSVMEQKAASRCSYCNECPARIAVFGEVHVPQHHPTTTRPSAAEQHKEIQAEALLFADEYSVKDLEGEPTKEASGSTRPMQRRVRTRTRRVQPLRGTRSMDSVGGRSTRKSTRRQYVVSDLSKGKSGGLEIQRDGESGLEVEQWRAAGATHDEARVDDEAEKTSTAATHGLVVTDAEQGKEPAIPKGVVGQTSKLSGGNTAAAQRRQRRAEGEIAAVHGILKAELKAQREERARVLRVVVRRLISELRGVEDLHRQSRRRRESQIAVAAVRKCEAVARARKRKATDAANDERTSQPKEEPTNLSAKILSEDEWLEEVARYEKEAPEKLVEEGSLQALRAARRRAVKGAKRFRWMRRVRRLQLLKARADSAVTRVREQAKKNTACQHKQHKLQYQYEQQGCYGDVELLKDDAGQHIRVAQLRTVGSGAPSCLPTALLALTRRHTHEVRLDSCAQYSIAGDGMRKYGCCLTRNPPVDVVEGFGGGMSRVLGVWRFMGTTVYQQRIIIDALLVEGQGDELLIGEDWMVGKRVKIDFASRELKYYDDNGQNVILPFTCHGVSTLQQANEPRKIVLNTGTCKIVTVRVDTEDETTGIFLPKPTNKRHLMIAPTVDTVNNGLVREQVLNVEGSREKLPARDALGTWIPVSEDMKLLSLNGELERKRVAQWVSRLRKEDAKPLKNEDKLDIGEMKQKDRDLVIALLRQYTEIVEKKPGCPPKAKINVEHHINTGDAAPIMMRRRRHAVAENELIDKEVDNMLEQGVIEPGEGVWGFPVVIVRKKDGSVRFCIDDRALNSVTIKGVYPLPRVDETLEALHGSQRFSSLDLHAGYWQLGVFEPDKPKTAFTTRRGLFQFTRMPFGLCNAPSTFQRFMNCVLRGLTWVCCLVYLDDVVIFTKGSVAQHVVELAVVLERLAEAGLSLKVSKCSFATARMEYLGHDLTPDGMQPTLRLVKAIVDFPTPADDTQVRRFVVLAGYYRRFVPEFGTKMAPLTCLLRKSTAWVWRAAQEDVFAWAKVWLSQNPVLIYPDYSLPFKLTTDASKTGLGAVLSQDQGKGDQPVAYASEVNSPTVAKYSISELEC
ncbi:polyprotein [Phytophthora megakarya]|uniref:Polyprotein n=1 Tax=Phytophthora megakarya TaxID=4795 RepID=A0A225VQC7_9STRA|nr:polyprotein [Phytophthora megakarya]